MRTTTGEGLPVASGFVSALAAIVMGALTAAPGPAAMVSGGFDRFRSDFAAADCSQRPDQRRCHSEHPMTEDHVSSVVDPFIQRFGGATLSLEALQLFLVRPRELVAEQLAITRSRRP